MPEKVTRRSTLLAALGAALAPTAGRFGRVAGPSAVFGVPGRLKAFPGVSWAVPVNATPLKDIAAAQKWVSKHY